MLPIKLIDQITYPGHGTKNICGDPADMSSLTNSLLTLQIDQIIIKPHVMFKFVSGY